MKIINKDMTRESIRVYVSDHQIHAEIFTKNHGKWCKEYYFQSYDWNIDEELILSTCREIKRLWDLRNPRITVIKF